MKARAELTDIRKKDAATLINDLVREKDELTRERIAVHLGKHSKVHSLKRRRARIARILSVLSEKVAARESEEKRP